MSAVSLHGAPARYGAGLQELGDGLYAWLQPNGALGESNAGLVVGDGESVLIDTLWNLPLTRRMLAAMAPHTARAPITTLVNTHADGDHCWGNQLLDGATIIATGAAREDMTGEDPRVLRALRAAGSALYPLARRAPSLPGAGVIAFAAQLRAFDFSGITVTLPGRTFEGRLELQIGGRTIELIEVGPAHTPGDLVVHVPDASAVFAADVLFIGCTPIMWVGPVERWLAALDVIAELDPRTIVPGHGPVTDQEGVRAVRAYWEFVAAAVRERVAAGMKPAEAAGEIVRSPEFGAQEFAGWDNPERIVVNAAATARTDRGERGRIPDRERTALLAAAGKLGLELRGGGDLAAWRGLSS